MRAVLEVSNDYEANYLHLVKFKTFPKAISAINTFYKAKYPTFVDFVSFSGNGNTETTRLTYQFVKNLMHNRYFEFIYQALPTVGVDGTLKNIPHPAILTGRLTGKSGTYATVDVNQNIVVSDGIGGYVTKGWQRLPFYEILANEVVLSYDDYLNDPSLLYPAILNLQIQELALVASLFFPASSSEIAKWNVTASSEENKPNEIKYNINLSCDFKCTRFNRKEKNPPKLIFA